MSDTVRPEGPSVPEGLPRYSFLSHTEHPSGYWTEAGIALDRIRRLTRERDEAQAQNAILRDALRETKECWEAAILTRDAARAELTRLREQIAAMGRP